VNLIEKIAEARIRDAMARGDFDNLAGRGQPLRLEDLSKVPEDLRAGYILLKNAGVLPEEMQVRKEMVTLEALVDACADPDERIRLRKDLNWKVMRFRMVMERRRPLAVAGEYRAKVLNRLGRSRVA